MEVYTPSSRVADLIRGGFITVNVKYSADGCNVWFDPVRSHPRLGIRTTQTFIDEASVELAFQKVVVAPAEAPKSKGKRRETPQYISEFAREPRYFRSNGEVLSFVREKNLKFYSRDGNYGERPSKSLCPSDFDSQKILEARTYLVASALGRDAMVGRIRAQQNVRPTTSLEAWWVSASGASRLQALSDRKKFRGTEMSSIVPMMDALPFPFLKGGVPVDAEEQPREEILESWDDSPSQEEEESEGYASHCEIGHGCPLEA
jgi:hypothetical protein